MASLYWPRGQKGAVLRLVGRDLEAEKQCSLEWDARSSCWQLLGNADEVAKASMQADILAAVHTLSRRHWSRTEWR
jgi:hypothetical protein